MWIDGEPFLVGRLPGFSLIELGNRHEVERHRGSEDEGLPQSARRAFFLPIISKSISGAGDGLTAKQR